MGFNAVSRNSCDFSTLSDLLRSGVSIRGFLILKLFMFVKFRYLCVLVSGDFLEVIVGSHFD